jgi:hypothetical protein
MPWWWADARYIWKLVHSIATHEIRFLWDSACVAPSQNKVAAYSKEWGLMQYAIESYWEMVIKPSWWSHVCLHQCCNVVGKTDLVTKRFRHLHPEKTELLILQVLLEKLNKQLNWLSNLNDCNTKRAITRQPRCYSYFLQSRAQSIPGSRTDCLLSARPTWHSLTASFLAPYTAVVKHIFSIQ